MTKEEALSKVSQYCQPIYPESVIETALGVIRAALAEAPSASANKPSTPPCDSCHDKPSLVHLCGECSDGFETWQKQRA